MKKLCLSLALATSALPVLATEVGVSVAISQPGVYGRVDIGRVATPPVLVYAQPVVVHTNKVALVRQPIYMHVPPGHAKHWQKHCAAYDACAQPVYFVQDGWYQQNYKGGHRGKHKHD